MAAALGADGLGRRRAAAAPAVEEVPYARGRAPARRVAARRRRGARPSRRPWPPTDYTFGSVPRTRAFARDPSGPAGAYGLLLDFGETALVEDVYTTPAERGRGLGAAVVAPARSGVARGRPRRHGPGHRRRGRARAALRAARLHAARAHRARSCARLAVSASAAATGRSRFATPPGGRSATWYRPVGARRAVRAHRPAVASTTLQRRSGRGRDPGGISPGRWSRRPTAARRARAPPGRGRGRDRGRRAAPAASRRCGWLAERLVWMGLDGAAHGAASRRARRGAVRAHPAAARGLVRHLELAGAPRPRVAFLAIEERVATRRGYAARSSPGARSGGAARVRGVLRAARCARSSRSTWCRGTAGTGRAPRWCARRWPRRACRRPGSSPTTRATRSGSTSGWAFATAWIQHVFTRAPSG